MSSIKRIDENLIKKVISQTGIIFTVEEHLDINALGSAVSEVVADYGKGRVIRIGIRDAFGISGEIDELFSFFGLDKKSIIKKIKEVLVVKS